MNKWTKDEKVVDFVFTFFDNLLWSHLKIDFDKTVDCDLHLHGRICGRPVAGAC